MKLIAHRARISYENPNPIRMFHIIDGSNPNPQSRVLGFILAFLRMRMDSKDWFRNRKLPESFVEKSSEDWCPSNFWPRCRRPYGKNQKANGEANDGNNRGGRSSMAFAKTAD